ncbi:glycolate oxidase subunit GlcE [Plastorhodobacter daqingensis]|uniref:Glycolate oxidase subunit GlcE n=1 Tax=Plastorhodobacter daqingensis TaxID=1387281 RepID=A0ABW2UHK1_9RHOB
MRPVTEADLAEAIRDARAPLRVLGGGTRPIGSPVVGEPISTSELTGITLYDPGALTLVAQAGTPLAEIEAALDHENQRLPFEPMDHRPLLGTEGEPTIGGVVAGNVSGPRRLQAGACRDSLIGVRFVDGAGTVIRNGGRVMKNVTGYDLVKLLAGSHGTLGVLTEVAFKLLPRPETQATLLYPGTDIATAVRLMSKALGTPYEVTGAAWAQGITCLRIEGFESSVTYRARQLEAALAAFGTAHRAEGDPWPALRDVTALGAVAGDIWRISVKPSDAPALVARIEGEVTLDWGGGLIWARVAPGHDLRAALMPFAGHATLIRADAETRRRLGAFHPEPAPLAALARGLREKFDPRGILNPGLMGV